MSVRVAYLARAGRGVSLRGLRLVGSTTDEWWPLGSGAEGNASRVIEGSAADINDAAAWVAQRMSEGRGDRQLAQVVLDCAGGVCSWLSTPSSSPDVIGALARSSGSAGGGFGDDRGGGAAGAGGSASAISYFATSSVDSSVQALPSESFAANGRSTSADGAMRLPVLAMTDVPARLLVDALDDRGIAVDGVCSLWHAMARVWDPSATARRELDHDPLRAQVEHVLAVVLVDQGSGRLIWTWSRGGSESAGQLLVAGSMRLRMHKPVATEMDEGEADDAVRRELEPVALFGADDAARLASEWLSWAAQIGRSPDRIVCVVPEVAGTVETGVGSAESDDHEVGPAALGEALSRAWPGATVTAAIHNDPIEATLRKLCDELENLPKAHGLDDPGRTLLDVTRRPRRMHRTMHLWAAGAIAAAAVFVVVFGMKLRTAGRDAIAKADQWKAGWQAKVRELHPEAFQQEKVGMTPKQSMDDAIKRIEDQLAPIERTDAANHVLPELETISMVVGNAGLSLVSLDLDAQRTPHAKLVATSPDLKSAEALLEALNHIGGSHLSAWTANYTTEATANNETKYRGTYQARWSTGNAGAGGANTPSSGSGGKAGGGKVGGGGST